MLNELLNVSFPWHKGGRFARVPLLIGSVGFKEGMLKGLARALPWHPVDADSRRTSPRLIEDAAPLPPKVTLFQLPPAWL